MLFYLIKKDFLIVKKNALAVLLLVLAFPPFLLWRMSEKPGVGLWFVFILLFGVLILTQYVSLKEYQSPKVTALLCSAPISRPLVVLSKYCFCLVVYVAGCLAYGIGTVVFPGLGGFQVEMVAAAFLMFSIYMSIYFPVLFKFGYEKARLIYFVIIVGTPAGIEFLSSQVNWLYPNFINGLPTAAVTGLCVLAGILFFALSALLSVRIFRKSDLA